MPRTAVVVCPGRGTYGKEELGYLKRHHASSMPLFSEFDAIRAEDNQASVIELDAADRFSLGRYSRGDISSPLIYASSLCDAQALADDIEVVAVTGNSMGWYIALAVAGALSATDGFRVVNTMGTLMQEHLIGGQLIYPFVNSEWEDDPAKRQSLLTDVAAINEAPDCVLGLSIELGGMLVLAGNEVGLKRFEETQPQLQDRFPMRLPNHAAFHTSLQAPVAEAGQHALRDVDFAQPTKPMVDGRGHTWWPNATDADALLDYTLGHQVTEPYDFTAAVQAAAKEFAPDLFIITGPGATLGGAVAQSLILCQWRGMTSKADFQDLQRTAPVVASMGMADQRVWVTN
ncbi:MAG: ACP S-malonyltransferase [Pseudomonadota bacterium]